MHLKMSPVKWRPFCHHLNVLINFDDHILHLQWNQVNTTSSLNESSNSSLGGLRVQVPSGSRPLPKTIFANFIRPYIDYITQDLYLDSKLIWVFAKSVFKCSDNSGGCASNVDKRWSYRGQFWWIWISSSEISTSNSNEKISRFA